MAHTYLAGLLSYYIAGRGIITSSQLFYSFPDYWSSWSSVYIVLRLGEERRGDLVMTTDEGDGSLRRGRKRGSCHDDEGDWGGRGGR